MNEDAALQQLHAILAQPEYQADTSPPLWERLIEAVGNFLLGIAAQLAQLFSDALTGREGASGLAAIALAAALLLLGTIYLVRTVQLAVTREARVRSRTAAERRQRSDELWREAERLASAGQLEDAARLAYLSALYALDERAVLHVEQGLTNREHARRLQRDHPRLGAVFLELVDQYERVRYGRQRVTTEMFGQLRALVRDARENALASTSRAAA